MFVRAGVKNTCLPLIKALKYSIRFQCSVDMILLDSKLKIKSLAIILACFTFCNNMLYLSGMVGPIIHLC